MVAIPKVMTLPKAPVGAAAARATAIAPSPGLFAHHAPMMSPMLRPESERMTRPRGGGGPRNAVERIGGASL